MKRAKSSIDNLILQSDTGSVNDGNDRNQPEKDSVWQKTPFVNLIRYKPSQVYFARFKIGGKLIRRSLKTNVITVAKLRMILEMGSGWWRGCRICSWWLCLFGHSHRRNG